MKSHIIFFCNMDAATVANQLDRRFLACEHFFNKVLDNFFPLPEKFPKPEKQQTDSVTLVPIVVKPEKTKGTDQPEPEKPEKPKEVEKPKETEKEKEKP